MVKLNAASTLGNRVSFNRNKRRKTHHDLEETQDAQQPEGEAPQSSASITTVPTKTHDGGKKPRRSAKDAKDEQKPGLLRRDSSTMVETTVPWPDQFKKLEQTHRALNLVYTFCCTRKHLATTFETIKSAVESHTKRELFVADVAKIKMLVPKAINFAYVDEALLQVNLMGEENNARSRRAQEFVIRESNEQDADQEMH